MRADGALQRRGELERAGRGRKGRHEAVAERLQLRTTVLAERVSGETLVGPQDVAPALVAEALHHLRVAFEVGEDDRAKGTGNGVRNRRGDGRGRRAAKELLGDADSLVGSPDGDETSIAEAAHELAGAASM